MCVQRAGRQQREDIRGQSERRRDQQDQIQTRETRAFKNTNTSDESCMIDELMSFPVLLSAG